MIIFYFFLVVITFFTLSLCKFFEIESHRRIKLRLLKLYPPLS